MKPRRCPQEEKVIKAARTGGWENSVRTHILQCAYCREVAEISEWMNLTAAADTRESLLPDPELLFMNAQVAAIQEAQEKALRPLAIAELIVRISIILILAGATLYIWFRLRPLTVLMPPYPYIPQYVQTSAAALVLCIIALAVARLAQPMLTGE